MLRRFNRNCNRASCTIIRQCSTTASAADKSTTTKTPNFQSYKAFENMDELRNKLTDKMSTIQKEEHMERENLGLNSGQSMADPIWYETHFGDSYKKKNGKFGEMEGYMNKDTAAQYMRVQDAARMLGINKDKIPGLTQKVIEEKFTLAYQRCQTPSEKDFVVSAAEYLLEYIKSPFAADVTRAKKYHLLQQMREDLDKENKSWHNQIFETLVYGASGYVTAVMTITGIAIIGFYFYNKAGSTFSGDANNITAESFGRFVRKSMNYDPNMEGSPDYTNRYRDTPTSYDMMKKEGHVEIGDPNVRKAFMDQDALQNKELSMIAMLMRDKDQIETKAVEVQKNETKRHEEPAGPRLLKDMMEKRIDAEWWENAKKLQALYQDSNFVSKW